ncbi:hypothetical protein TRVL_06634 [Trypanosoma vivax]|nr:hypothetical protein TRVL_06634 [Trypanosoma vivax]
MRPTGRCSIPLAWSARIYALVLKTARQLPRDDSLLTNIGKTGDVEVCILRPRFNERRAVYLKCSTCHSFKGTDAHHAAVGDCCLSSHKSMLYLQFRRGALVRDAALLSWWGPRAFCGESTLGAFPARSIFC